MEKVEALNQLLANHAVHYQRLRNFHWNVKGPLFYTLHQTFEDIYTQSALNVDSIAEQILTLGERPLFHLQGISKSCRISGNIEPAQSQKDG